jgi:UDP-3-O-[3-hydroxymyristoyl] glucosamine N-acyltransferase
MIDQNFYIKNLEEISLDELKIKFNFEIFSNNNLDDQEIIIKGLSKIQEAKIEEISFITNKAYLPEISKTKAKVIIIENGFLEEAKKLSPGKIFITCKTPYNLFGELLKFFYSEKPALTLIAKSAIIASTAKIGKNTYIGENTVIGEFVTIGDTCKIGSNNVITYCQIENHVEIAHGNSIGQDGFGFAMDENNQLQKMPQLGLVKIQKNVSIGSNNTIDRGSMGDTVIGEGTKIDNLVHISHNVVIGKYCIITAQNGIAGSTTIGDYVTFGGQCGVAGHLKIGSFNRFAAQAGITKSFPDNGGDFYGMPARPKKNWQKEQIALRKLGRK